MYTDTAPTVRVYVGNGVAQRTWERPHRHRTHLLVFNETPEFIIHCAATPTRDMSILAPLLHHRTPVLSPCAAAADAAASAAATIPAPSPSAAPDPAPEPSPAATSSASASPEATGRSSMRVEISLLLFSAIKPRLIRATLTWRSTHNVNLIDGQWARHGLSLHEIIS
jgi:hypothetical protein